PGHEAEERDDEAATYRWFLPMAIERDEDRERERDAEGKVEHAHRHEPVVDHRPGEEPGDEHLLAAAGQGKDEARNGDRVGAKNEKREESRREGTADRLPNHDEPREQGGVRLEIPVERELRV